MRLSVTFNPETMGVTIDPPVVRDYRDDRDPYTGTYEVTPTRETQILETNGLRMTDNVVINPIPSNYGLVTWDWRVLTIS